MRLLKPMTHMNRSGWAVAGLARYYRLDPEEILVAHDEIDLPPGTVRLKEGGGDGGHRGLRDVIPSLGSREFLRLRIGVGHPGHRDDVIDYVLRGAPAAERTLIDVALDRALEQLERILEGQLELAMNELHRRPEPAVDTDV